MAEALPRLPALPPSVEPVEFLQQQLAWGEDSAAAAKALVAARLPPLATVRTLPFVLGVSHSLINRMRRSPERFYRRFEIPRRAGPPRTIASPRVALKLVQRWVHEQILLELESDRIATAFAPGSDIFANARPHQAAKNLLQTDISDFFGSVPVSQVMRIFLDAGFPTAVSTQLADLTMLDGGLPQGAPTSPLISNFALRDLDSQLRDFANARDARVTRYADDLSFSSNSYRFDAEDVREIARVLEGAGYHLNERKTRIVGGGFRHVIAGISTSERLQYPRRKRRAWRALFYRALKQPEQFVGEQQRLLGIAAAVFVYDPQLAAHYRSVVSMIPGHTRSA